MYRKSRMDHSPMTQKYCYPMVAGEVKKFIELMK